MAFIKAGVYAPPENSDLPFVAVVIGIDGEVLSARSVPTIEAGEALLAEVTSDAAKQFGVNAEVIDGPKNPTLPGGNGRPRISP